MKKYFSLLLCIVFLNVNAEEYLWTAGGDGVSLFQESNWSLNGASPESGTINPSTPLSFDLLITSGNVGGGGFSPHLSLGGQTLTMTGGNLVGASSNKAGINSGLDNTKGNMLVSGGYVSCEFINDVSLSLSNGVSLLMYSADPFTGSTIAIASTFTGEIKIQNTTKADVESQVLPLITVNGQAAVLGTNIFLSDLSGAIQISLDEREDVRWDSIPTGNKDYSDTPKSNDGPNIIFILMDDLGYGDLGVLWQNTKSESEKKILTPHLDKMAQEGCVMTDHYCPAPVCAPSRASLLQGLHQGHATVRNNQFDKAISDELTVANVLQCAGYRTMHVGKNGVAGGRNNTTAHPLVRGFDQYYGYLYHVQGHIHYPLNGTTGKNAFFSDGYRPIKVGTELTYTTDVFTAKAKQWISTHEETRPEQPFFLYLAYDVPHSALQAATQAYPAGFGKDSGLQWTGYENVDGTLVETPWVNTASGTSNSYIPPAYDQASWTSSEQRYAAMIERVDMALADLIQTLKDYNIDDNTMIVFTSDNGNHKEGGHNPRTFESFADGVGIKRDLTEGGIRMPLIVRYPEVIPAETESDFNSGFWDWLATFADVADAPIPARTDGVSLMPALSQLGEQQDKGYTYIEYFNGDVLPNWDEFGAHANRARQEMQVIRFGDYKGMRYNIASHSDDFEIYDVSTDRGETNNLASSMPELQQKMKDKVLQVRKADASAARPYDDELVPAVEIVSEGAGLQSSYYEGAFDYVPDFLYMSATATGVVSNIDFALRTQDAEIGFMFEGYLNVPTDGTYTFYTEASGSYHLKVHDIHLLNDDYTFSGEEKSASLKLKAGRHPITLYYQQNVSQEPSLSLQLSGPSISKAPIPDAMFDYGEIASNLQDIKTLSGVNIYPSIVDDKLNVTFDSESTRAYQIRLYNTMGTLIKSKAYTSHIGQNVVQLSTQDLVQGMYVVQLQELKTLKTYNQKIVK